MILFTVLMASLCFLSIPDGLCCFKVRVTEITRKPSGLVTKAKKLTSWLVVICKHLKHNRKYIFVIPKLAFRGKNGNSDSNYKIKFTSNTINCSSVQFHPHYTRDDVKICGEIHVTANAHLVKDNGSH